MGKNISVESLITMSNIPRRRGNENGVTLVQSPLLSEPLESLEASSSKESLSTEKMRWVSVSRRGVETSSAPAVAIWVFISLCPELGQLSLASGPVFAAEEKGCFCRGKLLGFYT